jgi:predicted nucleotide-binding protein (sugar kinase/HSP70/actin superfamily)
MLGLYENFPENIHRIESFTSSLSSKKLQQRMIQVLHEINRKTFSFEEIAHPTVPECAVIFEVGIAESKSFNYIDEEETNKMLNALKKEPFRVIDLFCAVRYYKEKTEKKTPLKFDYYMMRAVFGKNAMEMRVFHERGLRHVSPEEIITFLVNKINEASARKILKRFEPPQ